MTFYPSDFRRWEVYVNTIDETHCRVVFADTPKQAACMAINLVAGWFHSIEVPFVPVKIEVFEYNNGL